MTKEEQTEMFNTYYMADYPSRKASATSKPTYAELEKENAELKDRNQELLESCEGATMMYKDLCKAKEIIKKYLAIGVGGKITQNYLDVTKEAKQFLKEEQNGI